MFRRTEKRFLCVKMLSHDRVKPVYTAMKQFPIQNFSCVKAERDLLNAIFREKQKIMCNK